jgi:hypothetical protein
MSQLVSEMININLILKSHDFSFSALAKWILSFCLNIHTLTLSLNWETSNSFLSEIACLKKLKKLDVMADSASDLKEVTLIAFLIMTTLFTSS